MTEIANMLTLTFENVFGREDTVRCIPERMRCWFTLLRLASPEFAGSGSEIGGKYNVVCLRVQTKMKLSK